MAMEDWPIKRASNKKGLLRTYQVKVLDVQWPAVWMRLGGVPAHIDWPVIELGKV
jgi:hypothetical protein